MCEEVTVEILMLVIQSLMDSVPLKAMMQALSLYSPIACVSVSSALKNLKPGHPMSMKIEVLMIGVLIASQRKQTTPLL